MQILFIHMKQFFHTCMEKCSPLNKVHKIVQHSKLHMKNLEISLMSFSQLIFAGICILSLHTDEEDKQSFDLFL